MELWSGVISSNAAKVRIVLAEKKIPYVTRELPWSKQALWGPKPAEFLAVSPRGEVPALLDNGFAIHDSTVIVEYLEENYPDVPLFPADLIEKTRCRIWEDEGDYNQKYVGVLISDVFMQPPGTPLSEEARTATAALTQFAERLDQQLDGRDYICREYSVADISVFITLFFAQTLGADITQPRVLSWSERMMSRPAVSHEIKEIVTAVAAL